MDQFCVYNSQHPLFSPLSLSLSHPLHLIYLFIYIIKPSALLFSFLYIFFFRFFSLFSQGKVLNETKQQQKQAARAFFFS
jgi:hypothetical protein